MWEAEFLDTLALGDRKAYDEAFRRYGPRVARLARRQLGHALRAKVDTQDIVQSVFREVAAGACRTRFDCERAFLAWLGVVIERKILQKARYFRAKCRDRRREVAQAPGWDFPDSRCATPSEIVSQDEDRERLILALAELREQDREVIVSRVLLALPWEAVARALGTTVEAAQMRLTRAYRHLKRILSQAASPRQAVSTPEARTVL